MYCIGITIAGHSIKYIIALFSAHLSTSFFNQKQTRLILSMKKLFALYMKVFDLLHCKYKYTFIIIKYYATLALSGYVLRTCNHEEGKRSWDFREVSDISTWKFSFLTWTHVRFKLAMRTRRTLPVNHRGKSAEHAEEEELNLHSRMQQPC